MVLCHSTLYILGHQTFIFPLKWIMSNAYWSSMLYISTRSWFALYSSLLCQYVCLSFRFFLSLLDFQVSLFSTFWKVFTVSCMTLLQSVSDCAKWKENKQEWNSILPLCNISSVWKFSLILTMCHITSCLYTAWYFSYYQGLLFRVHWAFKHMPHSVIRLIFSR